MREHLGFVGSLATVLASNLRRAIEAITRGLECPATDAMKYGALSTPDEVVRIAWEAEQEQQRRSLRLDLREENGPPCKAGGEPGFGSRLVQFGAGDLGGTAELALEAEGCRLRLTFPLA